MEGKMAEIEPMSVKQSKLYAAEIDTATTRAFWKGFRVATTMWALAAFAVMVVVYLIKVKT